MRSLSLRSPHLLGDAINNVDFSLSKNTNISERYRLEFRWEMFNAFNRAQFGGPNLTPTSGAYGTVSGTVASPRQMQFGLKLAF